MNPIPIKLRSSLKGYTRDLDKNVAPEITISRVYKTLSSLDLDIVACSKRVDVGRLGIPVYMGVCGKDAASVIPARKQMGKGSSVAQAEASALMELMERYAFFSFWKRRGEKTDWQTAKQLYGDNLISPDEIARSANDALDQEIVEKLLNLLEWDFYPATRLSDESTVWLPLDWFRLLGEFNGTSAGNTTEESLLQGLCELMERHVCCLVDRERPILPTINTDNIPDPALQKLLEAFRQCGINLVLKDISYNMPVPVVAALAWDPATFPDSSEIVFTAGAATSPVKAAIRAVTEVAQLGGDFCTNSCYEASGLPKFLSLSDFSWVLDGPSLDITNMRNIKNDDILVELKAAVHGLKPVEVYGVDITHPQLQIPAHYSIAPGLDFRERDRNQSVGLFIGRKLVEDADMQRAIHGIEILAREFPDAHYLPFFRGQLALRQGEFAEAFRLFNKAAHVQPDSEAEAMANFYAGYSLFQSGNYTESVPCLKKAVTLSPMVKEYHNLLGVLNFKNGNYETAENCFSNALKIDKGSAMDFANRGLCRKYLGRLSEARTDLEIALELDPDIEFAKTNLAEME